MLESGAVLKQRGWDGFRIVFVGTGDAQPLLKKRCQELGLDHRVEFKGFVAWEDVIALYRNAHVFVLPSFNEGMSALLEAMASGLPVIVTDGGGTKELVSEKNGLVVLWAVPDALASALAFLLESPERMRRMGQNSQRIAMQFDWEHFTRRHVALFSRVLEDSSGVQV